MAYPTTLDNLATNKTDSTVAAGDHAAHHDALATAVNAIEAELGTTPRGSFASVAARLNAAPAFRTLTAASSLSSADDILLLDPTGLARPLSRSVTAVATGGTFAAGYYQWQITAIDGSGHESVPTIGVVANLALNGSANLTWTAVTGATGYKIYRSVFSFATPSANAVELVTTLGAVTSYTDTGTATNPAIHPPTANGAAFSLTLPAASGFNKPLRLEAIGKTPNLVTINAAGGDNIEGASSLALGITYLADWANATLYSDGANTWRVIGGVKPHTTRKFRINTTTRTIADGVIGPVVVVPCPVLIPDVTRMVIRWTMTTIPGSGVTELTPSINRVDSSGNYLGNMAYWSDDSVLNGDNKLLSGSWVYAPRNGDVDFEDGSGKYIGLSVAPSGGSVNAYSAELDLTIGSFDYAEWF